MNITKQAVKFDNHGHEVARAVEQLTAFYGENL